MTFGRCGISVIIAAVMAVPVQADCPGAGCPAGGDFGALVTGLIGGIIGGIIPGSMEAESVSYRCRMITETKAKGELNGEAIVAEEESNVSNPEFFLLEQFCASRAYAMAQGLDIRSKIASFTLEQIVEQCSNLVPLMMKQNEMVSLKPRDEVLLSVSAYLQQSGMAPDEPRTTARVCLGEGFARNKEEVALSAALLLTALGDRSYSELIGYMLVSGIGGVMKRPDLALAWYELSLDGLADGESTELAPNMPDRAELIRKAAVAVAAASAMNKTLEEAPTEGQ